MWQVDRLSVQTRRVVSGLLVLAIAGTATALAYAGFAEADQLNRGASISQAAPQTKTKSIWGPAEIDGESQFPVYRDLGVGIYQMAVAWSDIAPTRPADPTNPADPAYVWPALLANPG